LGNLKGRTWKTRRRWEDNIRMDVRETVGRCGMDLAGSGYESVMGSFENDNKPVCSIKGGEFLV
jgi:hypothetical protein